MFDIFRCIVEGHMRVIIPCKCLSHLDCHITLSRVPCDTVGPCWLSISNIAVCPCPSQIPWLSLLLVLAPWQPYCHLYFNCAFPFYLVTHLNVTTLHGIEHLILTLKHTFRVHSTYKIRKKAIMEGWPA